MKLLGYPQLGAERFACVRDEGELEGKSGQILCFERSSEALLLRCVKAGLQTALWVHGACDVLWGMNYGVSYLLAPLGESEQNLAEWQRIVQDYLSDCLLVRVIEGKDEELLDSVRLRIDAVVRAGAISGACERSQ